MTKIIKDTDGIRLLSGAMFDYDHPEKSKVTIDDIATALSNVCRFSGHVQYFYSVAQHCVNVSRLVAPQFAYVALMHDTAEAFTNDIPTPLKTALPIFKELEQRIETAMANKFRFRYPYPPEVKIADLQMLKLEKEIVKQDFSRWSCLDGVDTTHCEELIDLDPMTPAEAREYFLARYRELGANKKDKNIELRAPQPTVPVAFTWATPYGQSDSDDAARREQVPPPKSRPHSILSRLRLR